MKNFWNWFKSSFEETPGRASGKAFSAFVLVLVWVIACLVAIWKVKGHVLPEWMGYTNAALIGGFYSIKLAGKMFAPGQVTEQIEEEKKA